MQTATTDQLVGRKLEGRYRILDRIARGGMSTVYAAIDERLDRMVAVKVMSSALSADPAFSDRFAREARAAARLTHLNAVSVYDQGHEIGPDGHHVFLVMELVEGRTLRELIRERGKLTPAEAVSIMEPVLSALSVAHRAGLIHRDIKPENILLSDEGVVKVADFGLARAVESDAAATRTGLMMGTVAYCAPEQISKGQCDPRSDVYSAGIVLFELLTGQPPYTGESAMNIAYQHVHSRVPAPSSRHRGIPSEIDEIVVAATDSDPTGRPADAGALLAELADVRAELDLPVTPVPPRARERKQRPDPRQSRSRTPDHATTDAIRARMGNDTALVPNGVPAGHQTTRMDDRRRDVPPPPVVTTPASVKRRKRRRALIGFLLVILLGLGAFFGAKAFIEWRFAHVPDVGGQSKQVAIDRLHNAGYEVSVQPGTEFSESIPAGHVFSTDPDADTRLATGKTVKLTVSAGPKKYVIPSTAGKSVDEALIALQAAGNLQVEQTPIQRYNDTVPAGRVIGTSPAANQRVTRSQPVQIIVSQGPPTISVPKIDPGTSLDVATKTLGAKKFKTTTDQAYSDTVPEGAVVSVSPSDTATKFSTITITVSRGPEMVTVPKIPSGTPLADAEQAVQNANLVPDVRRLAGGSDGGVVLATTPSAGTSVHAGSTVTLYVIAN
ncbi:MAG: Stk1 family PASTA domain-containing Ser/Thr kinase [Jatrophihabitans sp.]